MGFLDAIKGLFSGSPAADRYAPPPPPSPEVQAAARAAWQQAASGDDFYAATNAAYDLCDKACLYDESVAAYQSLYEKHADKRGEVATMIGQTLYLGKAGYKVTLTDAEKAAVYVQALDWYVKAAEAGDRGEDLNYVEMCEWLAKKPELRAKAQPYVMSFDKLFPNNEYRSRIAALKA